MGSRPLIWVGLRAFKYFPVSFIRTLETTTFNMALKAKQAIDFLLLGRVRGDK